MSDTRDDKHLASLRQMAEEKIKSQAFREKLLKVLAVPEAASLCDYALKGIEAEATISSSAKPLEGSTPETDALWKRACGNTVGYDIVQVNEAIQDDLWELASQLERDLAFSEECRRTLQAEWERLSAPSARAEPVLADAMGINDDALNEAGWKLLECAGPAIHANRCKDVARAVLVAYINSVQRQAPVAEGGKPKDDLLEACATWQAEMDLEDGLDNVDSALYSAIVTAKGRASR